MGSMRQCRRTWVGLSLAILVLVSAGCRRADSGRIASPEAKPLPRLERDFAEESTDEPTWAMWRGPNGSGIAVSPSPRAEFSTDDGHLWKTRLPGSGNSSPVLWQDRVFLTTALETTDPPTLAVLAVDRASGQLLWQTEVGRALGPTHAKNGYASASVATDGKHLFAFFGTTGLFCLDLAGTRLWTASLGNLEHRWGTAASPVLYDDLVIQLCDSEQGGSIAAFRQASGEPVWRTARPGTGCWSTPVLATADVDGKSRVELIVNGGDLGHDNGWVTAYDPASGEELWRVAGCKQWVTPTPVIGNNVVYCMSGRDGPIMAIRLGGRGDVTQSHLVWKVTSGGSYIPSALLYRNRLFVVGDSQQVACYNAGSGERIWEDRLGGAYTASPIAADGRVYAVSEQGKVSIFRAADSFERLAENDLGERVLATPAIFEGQLFLRTAQHLYCIPAE